VVRLSDTTTPVHAEALVRWHLDGRVIPPDEFIPVAEETGLIVSLGDWIIDRAAQLAGSAPGGQVMVNLSARQLASPGLPGRIARVLATRRLPASSLGFEITETLLIEVSTTPSTCCAPSGSSAAGSGWTISAPAIRP
jgi:EAL domain-containing protein (putative c-di-GMP-specific phosphodiesterase class I)